MNRSLLAVTISHPPDEKPDAIALLLHDRGERPQQAVAMMDSLRNRALIAAPYAPREVDSYTAPPRLDRDAGGYWYNDLYGGAIEATRFGDSLARLEILARELHSEWNCPLIVVGLGQGGCLAIALAYILPRYLSGIAAIDGHMPKLDGWSAPERDLTGLQTLLLETQRGKTPARSLSVDRTEGDLRSVGAHVSRVDLASPAADPHEVRQVVEEWFLDVMNPSD